MSIARRSSVQVCIGPVTVGGGAPIVVQSMTNTDTADIAATTRQVQALAARRLGAGAPDGEHGRGGRRGRRRSRRAWRAWACNVPLIGDFHFNGHKLLREHPACAQALAKYRINPGNVGRGSKRDPQFAEMIEIACRYEKPVRIGVNWGSLDQELLARLMDENSASAQPPGCAGSDARGDRAVRHSTSAVRAEELGLPRDAHHPLGQGQRRAGPDRGLPRSGRAAADYPLHLGLTEAGMGSKGIVASTAGMAVLLQQGIGDTIRVSLTPEPDGDRTQEVIVAQEILQTMGLRAFTPQVTACPGCGRTTSTFFQELAQRIQALPARQHAQVARRVRRRRGDDASP